MGGESGMEAKAEEWLTWVVEMLDKPVLEDGQRCAAQAAFLPPVETRQILSEWSRRVIHAAAQYLAICECESFSAAKRRTAAERALWAGSNMALTRDRMA